MRVVYAERARRDVSDIYDSIAPHNRAAAQRVEEMIRAVCEGLAEFPFAAPTTDEPNVRRIPLVRFPYTIFYRVDASHSVVEVARVLHSARITNLGRMPEW